MLIPPPVDDKDGDQGSMVSLVFRQSKRKLQDTEARDFLDLCVENVRRWGRFTNDEVANLYPEIGGNPRDTGPDERELEFRVYTTKKKAIRIANGDPDTLWVMGRRCRSITSNIPDEEGEVVVRRKDSKFGNGLTPQDDTFRNPAREREQGRLQRVDEWSAGSDVRDDQDAPDGEGAGGPEVRDGQIAT